MVVVAGGGGMIGVNRRARVRNPAIWPRVTLSSRQKLVFAGGLQPSVIRASATSLIPGWKIELSSSTKWSVVESGKFSALDKNAAISPRVMVSSPQ